MGQSQFCLKLCGYLAFISCWFMIVDLLILHHGWRPILKECGLLEWMQVGVLFLSFVGFVGLAVRWSENRWVFVTLAYLIFATGFREFNDTALGEYISEFPGLKESLGSSLLLSLVIIKRREIFPRVRSFCNRPSMVLFILGSFVTIFWAQPLGLRRGWESLFEQPSRGKRMVEENLEFAGYVLILGGVIEEIQAYRNLEQQRAASASSVEKTEGVLPRRDDVATLSR